LSTDFYFGQFHTYTLKEEIPQTFGQSLALVYQGNKLINKIILEEGWGRTDYRKNSQRDKVIEAFYKAQKYKRGIWDSLCRIESGPTKPTNSTNCQSKAMPIIFLLIISWYNNKYLWCKVYFSLINCSSVESAYFF